MIQRMGGRGRRCAHLLYDIKEKRRTWKFEEEALDRTLWRISYERQNKQ
jgi:hypothetical protein